MIVSVTLTDYEFKGAIISYISKHTGIEFSESEITFKRRNTKECLPDDVTVSAERKTVQSKE